MKNTPSVYVANQGSGFGDSQIFLRGFDDTNTAFLLNGQPINGQEDGRMYWSNWSGMSDVANAVQVVPVPNLALVLLLMAHVTVSMGRDR